MKHPFLWLGLAPAERGVLVGGVKLAWVLNSVRRSRPKGAPIRVHEPEQQGRPAGRPGRAGPGRAGPDGGGPEIPNAKSPQEGPGPIGPHER